MLLFHKVGQGVPNHLPLYALTVLIPSLFALVVAYKLGCMTVQK